MVTKTGVDIQRVSAFDFTRTVFITGDVHISQRTQSALDAAFAEAAKMKDQYVSIEHIILAITDEEEGDAVKILKRNGVTRDSILKATEPILENKNIL